MEVWVLCTAVGIGAGCGILVAMFLNAKRDVKDERRRLAEIESRDVDARHADASPVAEGPQRAANSGYRIRALQAEYARNSARDRGDDQEYPFFAALQAENARITAQVAELKNDKERDREKIKWLESEKSRLIEFERKVGELQQANGNRPAEIAELNKERENIQVEARRVKSAEEQLPELGRRNVQLERENARLMAEVAELKKERDGHCEKVQCLETVEKRLPEMERQMADLMSAFKTLKGEKGVS